MASGTKGSAGDDGDFDSDTEEIRMFPDQRIVKEVSVDSQNLLGSGAFCSVYAGWVGLAEGNGGENAEQPESTANHNADEEAASINLSRKLVRAPRSVAVKRGHPIFLIPDVHGHRPFVKSLSFALQHWSSLPPHPSLIHYYGVSDVTGDAAGADNPPGLVVERMGMSLYEAVQSSGSVAWTVLVDVAHDVAYALSHMHSNAYVHRAVTNRCVLFTEDPRDDQPVAKLGGHVEQRTFHHRLSRIARRLKRYPSSFGFAAPETVDPPLRGGGGARQKAGSLPTHVDAPSDVYSLGAVLLSASLAQEPSFIGELFLWRPGSTGCDMWADEQHRNRQGQLKQLEEQCPSAAFVQLVRQCLERKEKARPAAADLVTKLQEIRLGEQYRASGGTRYPKPPSPIVVDDDQDPRREIVDDCAASTLEHDSDGAQDVPTDASQSVTQENSEPVEADSLVGSTQDNDGSPGVGGALEEPSGADRTGGVTEDSAQEEGVATAANSVTQPSPTVETVHSMPEECDDFSAEDCPAAQENLPRQQEIRERQQSNEVVTEVPELADSAAESSEPEHRHSKTPNGKEPSDSVDVDIPARPAGQSGGQIDQEFETRGSPEGSTDSQETAAGSMSSDTQQEGEHKGDMTGYIDQESVEQSPTDAPASEVPLSKPGTAVLQSTPADEAIPGSCTVSHAQSSPETPTTMASENIGAESLHASISNENEQAAKKPEDQPASGITLDQSVAINNSTCRDNTAPNNSCASESRKSDNASEVPATNPRLFPSSWFQPTVSRDDVTKVQDQLLLARSLARTMRDDMNNMLGKTRAPIQVPQMLQQITVTPLVPAFTEENADGGCERTLPLSTDTREAAKGETGEEGSAVPQAADEDGLDSFPTLMSSQAVEVVTRNAFTLSASETSTDVHECEPAPDGESIDGRADASKDHVSPAINNDHAATDGAVAMTNTDGTDNTNANGYSTDTAATKGAVDDATTASDATSASDANNAGGVISVDTSIAGSGPADDSAHEDVAHSTGTGASGDYSGVDYAATGNTSDAAANAAGASNNAAARTCAAANGAGADIANADNASDNGADADGAAAAYHATANAVATGGAAADSAAATTEGAAGVNANGATAANAASMDDVSTGGSAADCAAAAVNDGAAATADNDDGAAAAASDDASTDEIATGGSAAAPGAAANVDDDATIDDVATRVAASTGVAADVAATEDTEGDSAVAGDASATDDLTKSVDADDTAVNGAAADVASVVGTGGDSSIADDASAEGTPTNSTDDDDKSAKGAAEDPICAGGAKADGAITDDADDKDTITDYANAGDSATNSASAGIPSVDDAEADGAEVNSANTDRADGKVAPSNVVDIDDTATDGASADGEDASSSGAADKGVAAAANGAVSIVGDADGANTASESINADCATINDTTGNAASADIASAASATANIGVGGGASADGAKTDSITDDNTVASEANESDSNANGDAAHYGVSADGINADGVVASGVIAAVASTSSPAVDFADTGDASADGVAAENATNESAGDETAASNGSNADVAGTAGTAADGVVGGAASADGDSADGGVSDDICTGYSSADAVSGVQAVTKTSTESTDDVAATDGARNKEAPTDETVTTNDTVATNGVADSVQVVTTVKEADTDEAVAPNKVLATDETGGTDEAVPTDKASTADEAATTDEAVGTNDGVATSKTATTDEVASAEEAATAEEAAATNKAAAAKDEAIALDGEVAANKTDATTGKTPSAERMVRGEAEHNSATGASTADEKTTSRQGTSDTAIATDAPAACFDAAALENKLAAGQAVTTRTTNACATGGEGSTAEEAVTSNGSLTTDGAAPIEEAVATIESPTGDKATPTSVADITDETGSNRVADTTAESVTSDQTDNANDATASDLAVKANEASAMNGADETAAADPSASTGEAAADENSSANRALQAATDTGAASTAAEEVTPVYQAATVDHAAGTGNFPANGAVLGADLTAVATGDAATTDNVNTAHESSPITQVTTMTTELSVTTTDSTANIKIANTDQTDAAIEVTATMSETVAVEYTARNDDAPTTDDAPVIIEQGEGAVANGKPSDDQPTAGEDASGRPSGDWPIADDNASSSKASVKSERQSPQLSSSRYSGAQPGALAHPVTPSTALPENSRTPAVTEAPSATGVDELHRLSLLEKNLSATLDNLSNRVDRMQAKLNDHSQVRHTLNL